METLGWQVYAQSDMTEGRGGMVPFGMTIYASEQAAWDSINTRGGVMGGQVGRNCYPVEHHREHGNKTWQDYKRTMGSAGDYDVRPVGIEEPIDIGIDRPLCGLCNIPKATGSCPHVIKTEQSIIMSIDAWHKMCNDLEEARNLEGELEEWKQVKSSLQFLGSLLGVKN